MSDHIESLVLGAARDLLASGVYPSLERLGVHLGYTSAKRLVGIRKVIASRGEWPVEIPATTNAGAAAANRREARRLAGRVGRASGLDEADAKRVEKNTSRVRAESVAELPRLPVLNHDFHRRDLTPRAMSRLFLARFSPSP